MTHNLNLMISLILYPKRSFNGAINLLALTPCQFSGNLPNRLQAFSSPDAAAAVGVVDGTVADSPIAAKCRSLSKFDKQCDA